MAHMEPYEVHSENPYLAHLEPYMVHTEPYIRTCGQSWSKAFKHVDITADEDIRDFK